MEKHVYGQLTVGFVAVVTVLMLGALPSSAWTGGGSRHGGGFHHGGFHHGFHHHRFFFHRHCCFGPRVLIGVGVGVPLLYPYPYPYAPPVVVESAPPVYVQPQQYWYYCQGAQAYYPYVKECPGGWLQVVPQPSPPP